MPQPSTGRGNRAAPLLGVGRGVQSQQERGCETGPGIAESATGGFISFANLKKESQPAVLAFLNGKIVPEKRPAEGEKEKDVPELYVVPPAKEKEKPEKPGRAQVFPARSVGGSR